MNKKVAYTQFHVVIMAATPRVHTIPDPFTTDLAPTDTRVFPPEVPPGEPLPLPLPNPGIPALVPPAVDEMVVPQAPTTEDKSFTLLRAAGVAPQFAACVIQTELPSKSKTAERNC